MCQDLELHLNIASSWNRILSPAARPCSCLLQLTWLAILPVSSYQLGNGSSSGTLTSLEFIALTKVAILLALSFFEKDRFCLGTPVSEKGLSER